MTVAVAFALPFVVSGTGSAAAATLQQCAVNFSVCYGNCASRHPPQDVSGLGLCQANCVSSRASCEATASDRAMAPPPGGKQGRPRVPAGIGNAPAGVK